MMDATSKSLWDAMAVEADKHGERNDCTVRALTASTGLDYDICHEQLRKQGRRNRKGCHFFIEGPKAAEALGYQMRKMDRSEYNAKTMITAERDRNLRSGRYCVLVRGHVAAMVDGKVIDWSQGRRHCIKAVYEVTKVDNAPTPVPTAPKRTMPKGSATWQSFRKYKKQDNYNLFD
jgi:hypothetical protein